MLSSIESLIIKQGIPVAIHSHKRETKTTKCLFGRASKQFNNTISLEYHRRAQFPSSITVDSGDVLEDLISHEFFIAVSTYNEFIDNQFILIVHLIKCNTVLRIFREVKTADNKGNIKTNLEVIYEDLKAHVQPTRLDMEETKVGLFPNTEYKIYTPGLDISLTDRLFVLVDGREIPLKIVNTDYVSYPGLVCIEASSETRK